MNSAADVFDTVRDLMKEELSSTTINSWFGTAEAVELNDTALVVRTDSDFRKQVIIQRYADYARRALKQLFSADMDFIVLGPDDRLELSPPLPEDDEYSFENFVVGASNRFAHAAALAVATNPARTYNPLFIYGGSGLGKTHLVKAISHAINRDHPSYRVLYVKGDDFVNDLIAAIANQTTVELRNKYRMVDVLIMDDVQFIAGKEQTQIEFFHTFTALYEAHKQIVLTSDRPPKEIRTLENRLQTRFEWGLLADIAPPEFETRMAIIKKKAERLGCRIPDDLVQYIASNVTANIRQLEGIVNRIKACKELLGMDVAMDTVTQAIRDMLKENPGLRPTSSMIIEEVCKYYRIEPDALKSKNRRKDVLLPRQVASYIIRNLTDLSLPEIGKVLGGQHYSTVINSIDTVESKMRADSAFESVVKELMNNITEG